MTAELQHEGRLYYQKSSSNRILNAKQWKSKSTVKERMSISQIGRVSLISDLVLGSAKRASFLNRNEMPEFQGDKKLSEKNFSSAEKNKGYGTTRFIEEHQTLFLSVLAFSRPSLEDPSG